MAKGCYITAFIILLFGTALFAEEPKTVEIPVEKQRQIGLKTVVVEMKPTIKTIRTVGRIELDEKRQATVNTKIDGWIERLYVDYTGRYVKKGEAIAEIYSPELMATQQEYLNLIKWTKRYNTAKTPSVTDTPDDISSSLNAALTDDALAIVEAARTRLKRWDITDKEIQRIEQTGKPIRTLTLYSPASGYVTEKKAVAGARVAAGEKLFDVADLSTLWVIADIYENELPMIKLGQSAAITLSYYPDMKLSAKIDYIYPGIAADTRTVKVRFSVPNQNGRLLPQMFTNVELQVNLGNRLVVPRDAIIDTGKTQVVYVDAGEGLFEPRVITVGLNTGDMVEVTRGLKDKEKVVAAASFLIDSEAKLKGIAPGPQK
ncbi:RND family efflux transporter MFP subunit [Candidatus Magnetominusculus xianensis]|uniref:RND family efflux transporter MFP subunit n=2 Tax=Candidatus Magnetominusculus xianensis TaxID=1748249 RepID=A0ABR5SI93_9BACT|nr:RND family efflux transporter MFP subunit [Candidatus Magnetominusculus xianensis]MBF0402579.1 efflux RND transporter periplasmic adaptor subunit [Nitrospirota bacterium]